MRISSGSPLTSSTGNAMPLDNTNPKNQRTLAPTLSASGIRTMNTTPLTPRVAGSSPANASTPMSKRGMLAAMASPLRDEQSLDNNITPRSGSRKTRVDSSNTTPTAATPTPNLQADPPKLYAGAPYGSDGSSIGGSSPYLRPAISFSSPKSEIGGSRDKPQPDKSSKFFYASDAKPTTPQPAPGRIPRPQAQRGPGGYLNARTGLPQPQGSKFGSSSSLSSMGIGREKVEAKFFHANGTPDLSAASSPGFSRPGSTISTMSYTSAPRLAQTSTTPRSTSPVKADNPLGYNSLRSPAGRRVPSSSISQNIHSPALPTPEQFSTVTIQQRRISGHIRSPSLSNLEHPASIDSNLGSEVSSAETTDQRRDSNQLSTISTDIGTDYFTSEVPSEDVSTTSSAVLRSPIKAGNSIERMNELAAAARTERKVMDLEITNSSLAAINRTLEREMRKQTAELRRYRRLSRSGRLSILPTHKHENDLSDMDEEDEESEENSEDDESEESSCADESQKSPEALAESDRKHSKRDEKLLQLDLSKHQQLLEDSQKMNQSLKRCLGFTEEMIKEGKRQLAFKVDKDQVEFGGRVLTAEELEDGSDETERQPENESHVETGGDVDAASSEVDEGSVVHQDFEREGDDTLGDERAFVDPSGSKLSA